MTPPRPYELSRSVETPSARNRVVQFTGVGTSFNTTEYLVLDDEADATSVQEMPVAIRPHGAVAPTPHAQATRTQYGAAERSSLVTSDPFALPPAAQGSPYSLSLPGPLTGPVLTVIGADRAHGCRFGCPAVGSCRAAQAARS